DDNAAVIVEYTSGALGIIETGFLSHGSPFQLELYGTEGTLLIEDGSIKLKSSHKHHDNWQNHSDEEVFLSPMEQWIAQIETGKIPTITKDDVLSLTLINQAAALSDDEGRRVAIKELIYKKKGF